MRTFLVALLIALLTVPASAQKMRGKQRNAGTQQSEEQKRKNAAAEKAYKSSLDKIPEQKYDPWKTTR